MAKSRYYPTAIINRSYYETWDLPDNLHGLATIDLLDGVKNFQYQTVVGDRLDKLANKYLGDDKYYWVIALVNNIDCPIGISPGTLLQIPSDINEVLQKLGMV